MYILYSYVIQRINNNDKKEKSRNVEILHNKKMYYILEFLQVTITVQIIKNFFFFLQIDEYL